MKCVFVQLRCQPGKTYEVAQEVCLREIASELYSTSGDFDLLAKIYVPEDQDIGVIPWSPLAGGFLTGKYERADRVPSPSVAGSVRRWRREMFWPCCAGKTMRLPTWLSARSCWQESFWRWAVSVSRAKARRGHDRRSVLARRSRSFARYAERRAGSRSLPLRPTRCRSR